MNKSEEICRAIGGRKRYVLIVTENEGEALSFDSTNYGFTSLEAYGLLAWKKDDIAKQINGEIKAPTVTRVSLRDEIVTDNMTTKVKATGSD
jgi:hypothetical protein